MIELYLQYVDKEAVLVVITITVWVILCGIAHNLYGE